MRAVVSDTSPIHYLICVDALDVLPRLFGEVLIPPAVHGELLHAGAPLSVREWATQLPAWVKVIAPAQLEAELNLGAGECEAIALVKERGDTLLLIDERKGRAAALKRGLRTAGTLILLEVAAERGLLDFAEKVERLKGTNFRISKKLLTESLERVRSQKTDRS